jgi:heptosyltransferase-2
MPEVSAKLSSAVIATMMRLLSRRMRRMAGSSVDSDSRPLPQAMSEARGILVVALMEAGDMVLLSPFLRELRHASSPARITLVCLPGGAILYQNSSDVDEVIPFAAALPRIKRPLLLPGRARAFARRQLSGRFDVAIVPRWDTDHYLASAVALFSLAGRRVAYSERVNPRKQTLNAGFDRLFTDVVESSGVAHEVERHSTLLRALGCEPTSDALTLSLTDADRHRAVMELTEVPSDRPIIAFGVGAADPKRRWPIARFVEVGRSLQRDHGAHVIVVGGPTDVPAQVELLGRLGAGATGLAGRLTLRETGAVLEKCALFVGNDSAPLHLAVAAGVPSVEISCHPAQGNPLHNNAPERFGPWRVRSAVLRPASAVSPCEESCRAKHPHCILEVSSDMVVRASADLLQTTFQSTELESTEA